MLFSVLDDLEQAVLRYGDKVAVVDYESSLTFSNLYNRAHLSAQALIELGVMPGDRVGVCMAKSSDQIIAILAVLYSNAIFVPILPSLKKNSISHIVNDSGMTAIIVDKKRVNEVEAFETQLKIIMGSGELNSNFPNLPYLCKHFVCEKMLIKNRLGVDIAAIIYSSGSTGRPKGIMVTHRNLVDGARIVSKYLGTNENDRIASILSFNFDYGLNQLWQALFTGATIYLHEFILPNDCIHFIARENITALPLMPAIMSRLFDPRLLERNTVSEISSVRYVCSSGGRVSQDMIDNIKMVFPKAQFFSMYGLTEAFRSTYLPPEQLILRPNSIGRSIPDVEILVLDERDVECPPGVPGELVHRGGCITRGYWNDPQKTAERFRSHARYPGEILVYSGDIVVKDAEGYITFINRKDEMLKNNGIRISPTEVEEAFEKYQNILSVAVFGIENIDVGHDIVMAYTTKDGSPILNSELLKFARTSLANHMIPRYFVHHNLFPTTGNQGKIDRISVKENSIKLLGFNFD